MGNTCNYSINKLNKLKAQVCFKRKSAKITRAQSSAMKSVGQGQTGVCVPICTEELSARKASGLAQTVVHFIITLLSGIKIKKHTNQKWKLRVGKMILNERENHTWKICNTNYRQP